MEDKENKEHGYYDGIEVDGEWIDIQELDRCNRADQDAFVATKIFIASVDWPLLKGQHDFLLDFNEAANTLELFKDDAEHIKGLLNLLSSLKDLAVDYFSVEPYIVFGEEDSLGE